LTRASAKPLAPAIGFETEGSPERIDLHLTV